MWSVTKGERMIGIYLWIRSLGWYRLSVLLAWFLCFTVFTVLTTIELINLKKESKLWNQPLNQSSLSKQNQKQFTTIFTLDPIILHATEKGETVNEKEKETTKKDGVLNER